MMKKKKLHFKRISAALMAVAMILPVTGQTALADEDYWPTGPEVVAPSAIVMEQETGTILYEKNSTDAHYPASITKILTGLLTVENSDLNDEITFSQEAVFNTEGSGIARDVGEVMTVEQTLYGMMLASANECAYALAEHVSGNVGDFAQLMNDRVASLGCVNTHFSNPHGLQDENHYTCAYDMALIAREAFKNEAFRKIMGAKTYTIPYTNKHQDEETYLQNHHEMLYPLKTREYLYDYCVGGKTGYTTVAGATLVTYATKDNMTLVCVVMNSTTADNYRDTRSLFDYCFDNFQLLSVAENEDKVTSGVDTGRFSDSSEFFEVDDEGVIVLPKAATFSDAEGSIDYDNAHDNVVATLNYTYAGRSVGSADVVLNEVETGDFVFDTPDTLMDRGQVQVNLKNILIVVAIIIAAILLTVVLALTIPKIYYEARRKRSQNKKGPERHVIENSLDRRRRRSERRHSGRKERFGTKNTDRKIFK